MDDDQVSDWRVVLLGTLLILAAGIGFSFLVP